MEGVPEVTHTTWQRKQKQTRVCKNKRSGAYKKPKYGARVNVTDKVCDKDRLDKWENHVHALCSYEK